MFLVLGQRIQHHVTREDFQGNSQINSIHNTSSYINLMRHVLQKLYIMKGRDEQERDEDNDASNAYSNSYQQNFSKSFSTSRKKSISSISQYVGMTFHCT